MSKGLVQNNPANDPDSKPVKSRSRFKPSYSMYQTALFGLNTPFFASEVVPDDKLSLRVTSDVDTYTLKAPLMSPVKMHKDYFFASLRSLLPNGAELLITNPRSGEDIVPEKVNNVLNLKDLVTYFSAANQNMSGSPVDALKKALVGKDINGNSLSSSLDYSSYLLACTLKFYQWCNPFFSTASLLRCFGYNVHDLFEGPMFVSGGQRRNLNYDEFLDLLIEKLSSNIESFKIQYYDSVSAPANLNGSTGSSVPPLTLRNCVVSFRQDQAAVNTGYYSCISFRHLLENMGQNWFVFSVYDVVMTSTAPASPTFADYTPDGFTADTSAGTNTFNIFSVGFSHYPWTTPSYSPGDSDVFVNINRLVAYQLANAQFYSNDSVDYVYSCRLWHENQFSLLFLAGGVASIIRDYSYTINGSVVRYDSCSGHCLSKVFNHLANATTFKYVGATTQSGTTYYVLFSPSSSTHASFYSTWAYLINIFGYQRSLRYRDYFVGSKPNPLAVGNVDVTVANNQFSVVDVTKNIQRQRFLNQVNRVGRKLGEYLDGIFGVSPQHDAHDILFLGSTCDIIGAQETDNTGEKQLLLPNSTTSKLRNNSSRYAFEGQFNEPGVIIGIMNFDIVRPYVRNMDRENLHIDRFDYFNPFMQTIGDQPVNGIEITARQDANFAYQLRYSEYKQRSDIAVGGFIGRYLPGYAFKFDPFEFFVWNGTPSQQFKLSPDFIRSHPFEFDQFYVSLTNFSPAGYFHFIIRHDLDFNAVRPMLAAPSIL